MTQAEMTVGCQSLTRNETTCLARAIAKCSAYWAAEMWSEGWLIGGRSLDAAYIVTIEMAVIGGAVNRQARGAT